MSSSLVATEASPTFLRSWFGAAATVLALGSHLLALSFVASLNLASDPTERFATSETFLDVSPVDEVETETEEVEQPEAPEKEPEPEPVLQPPIPSQPSNDAPKQAQPEVPPAPAEAGQVLAAPDGPLDLSSTIVMGKGARYAGGITAAEGTEKKPVRSRKARIGGVGRGRPATPSRPAAPRRKVKDLSRNARLAGGGSWECPFPLEANASAINRAAVSLLIRVGPSGKVEEITVTKDPGYGFAAAARRCASRKRWEPRLDERGIPVTGYARLRVRFER